MENEIKEELQSETLTDAQKAELKAELTDLCHSMKETHKLRNEASNKLDAQKERFKQISEKLGVEYFEDEDVKVTMTKIQKLSLKEDETINYLKENNLNQYIHTKEYFDYAELDMAVAQNKIKARDLADFRIIKEETRINIK